MIKRSLFAFLLTACVMIYSCKSKPEPSSSFPKTGSVERLSTAMDDIIEPGVLPEIIADSFLWSEGPVWIPEHEMLLFSDIPQNSVFKWTEKDGLELYLKPAGYTDTITRGGETGSNGLLLDLGGRLVLCQHGDRRLARMDAALDNPEDRFVTLAAEWNGKRFNSPNDAVFSSKGELFFTDPAYGMELQWNDPNREIDFAGVYKLALDGEVRLLIDSISAPNGIGLSPDESSLYVASSGPDKSIYEYKFSDDGSLVDGKIFFDASKNNDRKGSPDGLVVRKDGIIFATGPGGVIVLDPEGNQLGSILTGQLTANCTLDEDGSWLYMTADMFLMRIKLK